jgi:phage tail-like protein
MAGPANETVIYPFTSFNFSVEIHVDALSPQVGKVCNAAFQECDGLEMSMDVKTIREGGSNDRQIRMAGPLNYGQLTLKRGMTASFDLWDWFSATLADPRIRGDAEVVLLAADGQTKRVSFVLSRCLPVKLKAPALSGKDGGIAIEEFQMAYESMTLKRTGG